MLKLQLEDTKQHVDSQHAEQQKLQKLLADIECEKIQQQKQLDQVKEKYVDTKSNEAC